MIVWLLNINDEPVPAHFNDQDEIKHFVAIAIADTMKTEEYCRVDVFKVEIPDDTPDAEKYDKAVDALIEKRKELEV